MAAVKGHKHSEETKKKIGEANSIALKGNIPWNKGKKLHYKVWNKGTKGICKANSTSYKKGDIPWTNGKHRSEETRDKIRQRVKGAWEKGKFEDRPSHNEETREKIRQTLIGRYDIPFRTYPLGWHKTFREQIRYRDGYVCRLCGVPEIELERKLSVHHIDYNKSNIKEKNLICLCHSCHSKTNFNRDKWEQYFEKEI